MDKLSTLLEWLKQPPTLKGLVLVAGLAGYTLDPEKVQIISIVGTALYAVLALFYDNSTRKPKVPTAEELSAILSSEAIVRLVELRKAKIAADKTIAAKVTP